MKARGLRLNLVVLVTTIVLQALAISAEFFKPFNVSYDHKALIIDGKRRMLISAGMHYPRATSDMWSGLIAKSKGGADLIQTYVFWNGRELIRGQYNFEGRSELVKFVKLVGSAGLYLHLHIGPYVCAEWNFGHFDSPKGDEPVGLDLGSMGKGQASMAIILGDTGPKLHQKMDVIHVTTVEHITRTSAPQTLGN